MDAAINAEERKPLSMVLRDGGAPQAWVDEASMWENSTRGPSRVWAHVSFVRDRQDQEADFHRLEREWGRDFGYNSDLSTLYLSQHPQAWAELHHVRLPPESGERHRDPGRLLAFEPGFAEWLLTQARQITTRGDLTGDPAKLHRFARNVFERQPTFRRPPLQLHALEIASKVVKNIGQAIEAGAMAPVDTEDLE